MMKSARCLKIVFVASLCAVSSARLVIAQSPAPLNERSAPQFTGRLRGTVWDATLKEPVAGALVWLPGMTASTKTDDKGNYELTGVPTGPHTVAFSSPSFDSTGIGTLQRSVVVQPNVATDLKVNTPTSAEVWKQLCGGVTTTPTDSGIAWGIVRDASNGVRQSGAGVAFSWYDAHVGSNKKMLVQELSKDVRTDSTGTYYACGLPTDIRVSSQASGTRASSGVIEYLIGARHLARVDLMVSTDMVLQPIDRDRTPAESIAALTVHGRSTLRGVVRDTRGVVQREALILLASVDTIIRTDARGEFRLSNLPAGTHVLQAKQIGFAPATTLVDLLPDSTTSALLLLSSSTQLATFNVRAERVAGVDKLGFDDRRRAGWGYALEYKDFKNRADIVSILQGTPGVEVHRVRAGELQVWVGFGSHLCPPSIYLDGVLSSVEEVGFYNVQELQAIEVYPRFYSAPAQYAREMCGVILFWSKRAKW